VQHIVAGRVAPGERPLTARYALDEVLARGGVGEVWRARDLRLGRPVAVKVLHGAQADPNFRTRFRAEAQHAARLSHPNIAAVFDYGEETAEDGDEPTPYLVMELVEGESLADLLARRGRLGVGRTLSILRQLSSALAAAHEAGVVHRDVKPANVLVRPDGVVKITDFGIAASAASAALTETGQVVGTARYLSPEQARGNRGTPASDVYALGLVGYECLAGHPAFDGPDPVEVAMKQVAEPPPPLPPDVPEQVRGLVGTATAKDPARRLPDGAALRDALDRLLEGGRRAARSAVPPHGVMAGYAAAALEPLDPPPAGASAAVPMEADEPAPRRRRWWPLAVAGVLLCGLATVLVLVGLTGAAGSPDTVRTRLGSGNAGAPATSGGSSAAGSAAVTGPAVVPAPVPASPTADSPAAGTTDGVATASDGGTGSTGTRAVAPAGGRAAAARSAGTGSTTAPATTDRTEPGAAGGTTGSATGTTAGTTDGTAPAGGTSTTGPAAGTGTNGSGAPGSTTAPTGSGSAASGTAGSGSTSGSTAGSTASPTGSGPTDAGATGTGTDPSGTGTSGTGTSATSASGGTGTSQPPAGG
jgi:eukaryotic-like serine/threonine-protein kinase